MIEASVQTGRAAQRLLAGAAAAERALPGLAGATTLSLVRAGGGVGAIAGVIIAGVKCFALSDRAGLTAAELGRSLGREVTAGAASGAASVAAGAYVAAAAASLGAVVSAPAWVPAAAATGAALGVGYVVAAACQTGWDRCVG